MTQPLPLAAVALREGVARLRAAGVDGAAGDARHLLAFATGVAADRLTLHLNDPLEPEAAGRFEAALVARVARQPVAQITGARMFWGRMFRVTRDVLDPRPDTEALIAAALERPFSRVLDMGTGTGCVVLTCLAEQPGAQGVATDISPAALEVARGNADALGLAARCEFVLSDWFSGVEGQFDLIVSNPPYIAADEIPGLAPEVREWEPHLALTPGGDGLDPYRKIAAGVGAHLAPGGRVLLEIGPTQAAAVIGFLAENGLPGAVCLPDMDGRDRVILAQKPL